MGKADTPQLRQAMLKSRKRAFDRPVINLKIEIIHSPKKSKTENVAGFIGRKDLKIGLNVQFL